MNLIVDEVELVIRIIAFLLPHADIEIVNEVTLWRVIHLDESLRRKENRILRLMGHKEILYNLVELVHVHLFLDNALSLHDVGSLSILLPLLAVAIIQNFNWFSMMYPSFLTRIFG